MARSLGWCAFAQSRSDDCANALIDKHAKSAAAAAHWPIFFIFDLAAGGEKHQMIARIDRPRPAGAHAVGRLSARCRLTVGSVFRMLRSSGQRRYTDRPGANAAPDPARLID
jgi:hypothetical protein